MAHSISSTDYHSELLSSIPNYGVTNSGRDSRNEHKIIDWLSPYTVQIQNIILSFLLPRESVDHLSPSYYSFSFLKQKCSFLFVIIFLGYYPNISVFLDCYPNLSVFLDTYTNISVFLDSCPNISVFLDRCPNISVFLDRCPNISKISIFWTLVLIF